MRAILTGSSSTSSSRMPTRSGSGAGGGPFVSLTHSPPQQPRAAPEGSGRKEGKENRQANKHRQNRGSRRAIDLTIPFSRNRRSVFGTAVSILTVPYVSFERRRIFSMAGIRVFTEGDSFPVFARLFPGPVSYTHLRAHETPEHLVCRLLLEKKKKN